MIARSFQHFKACPPTCSALVGEYSKSGCRLRTNNSMKQVQFVSHQLLRLALAASLLLLCAWPKASIAQTTPAYAVVAWGDNLSGQTTIPLVAQSGVTTDAAGPRYTVALIRGVKLLPTLNARPTGKELIFSWPTNAPGFTFQSTLDLTPPVTWLDSTNLPTVIGTHFTLTNSTSSATRFYRLRNL